MMRTSLEWSSRRCWPWAPLAHAAGTPQEAADAKAAVAAVNLNTASASQLEALPGIGAKMAQRIVEYRQKNGAFKKIEELMNVKGIGEKSFLKLKPQLTVVGAKGVSSFRVGPPFPSDHRRERRPNRPGTHVCWVRFRVPPRPGTFVLSPGSGFVPVPGSRVPVPSAGFVYRRRSNRACDEPGTRNQGTRNR